MKINAKWLLMLPFFVFFMSSCDDEVSYSDMKNKEKRAIKNFIADEGINVISFKDFIENDSVTDVDNNEYVLIDDVYMQIVRNPKDVSGARKIKDGDKMNIMARFFEYNISEADTITGNLYDSDNPDYIRISYKNGSYTATFTSGYMCTIYGSSVPTGWLTPLPYLYFTRHQSQAAKVNLIVPHTKGTSTASSYVYPCFYQITFIPESLYDVN